MAEETVPSMTANTVDRSAVGFWLLVAMIASMGLWKTVVTTLDLDAFWHLRVADQLRTDGIGPLVDRISFASIREPWTPYSWLAELGMKAVWDRAGYRGAIAVQGLIVAGIIGMTALACQELAGPQRRLNSIVGVVLAAYLSLAYLSFRPVTLAIFLLAVVAWLLLRDRRLGQRSKGVWWVIPITVVLTNVHLTVVVVTLWIAALVVGALNDRGPTRRYAVMLMTTSAACLATPMLAGVVHTALHYQFSDVMVASTFISEMQPFYQGTGGKITALVVLGLWVASIRNQKKVGRGERLMLIGSFILMLRLGRFAPVFALIAAPFFAATLPQLSDRVLTKTLVWGVVFIALFVGLARISMHFPARNVTLCQWLDERGKDALGYPCAAADYVETNIARRRGRLINEFNWGGFLAWRLGGQYQVLLDGRTQLYTREFWLATYLGNEQSRVEVLSHADADVAILPVRKSLFRPALFELGWKSVYQDDFAEVMIPPASK